MALAHDTTIDPIPDFTIGILSPATEKRDRGVKLEDYAAHGVAEYWIVDADKRTIGKHLLDGDEGVYHLAEKPAPVTLLPRVFPD